MKKIIISLLFLFPCVVNAQWTTAGSNIYNSNTGNVGVGTTSPNAKVEFLGATEQLRLSFNATNYTSLAAASNGGLGISTIGGGNINVNPSGGAFAISGGLIIYGANSTLYIPSNYAAISSGSSTHQYASSATNFLRTAFFGNGPAALTTGANYSGTIFASTTVNTPTSGTNAWLSNVVVKPVGSVNSGGASVTNTASLYIDGVSTAGVNNFALFSSAGNSYFGGSVGIGAKITDPNDKLSVNGTIHAKEIKVDLSVSGWPDFVFNSRYKLPTLKGLKKYIALNHHLPEMPTEKEVIASGVNLGQMNKLLLQKVEELTLYMIAKDEQLNRQQADIDLLRQQVVNFLKACKKEGVMTSTSTNR